MNFVLVFVNSTEKSFSGFHLKDTLSPSMSTEIYGTKAYPINTLGSGL